MTRAVTWATSVASAKVRPARAALRKSPPPAFGQVEPADADRDEDLMDPRVFARPLADGAAGVAGEAVGHDVELSARVGPGEFPQ